MSVVSQLGAGGGVWGVYKYHCSYLPCLGQYFGFIIDGRPTSHTRVNIASGDNPVDIVDSRV